MKSFVVVQLFIISKSYYLLYQSITLLQMLIPCIAIRLLELVAEDAALEDTIYHLGRGLNSENANIDLDQFLKVSLFYLALVLLLTDFFNLI